jgi:N-acetylglutamate synthase-like GNAT family acetyltransferase
MFEISNLADRPEHIPTLANWHFAQWGELNPANDVAARIVRFETHLQKDAIPTTFVACAGAQLLGSASLVFHDLDIRPQYTPWLASVYVDSAQRSQGVGRALVRRVMQAARELAVPTLYLFTLDRETYYASLGWETIERTMYREKPIVIMQYATSAASSALPA